MMSYKQDNRNRLIRLLSAIPHVPEPKNWKRISRMAVGGLHSIGFSRQKTHLLLVLSSTGRSIIDCNTGDKLDRDYDDDYAGLNQLELTCDGFGLLANELITISGIGGGGLPMTNKAGETLETTAPDWPEQDLIFCTPNRHPLVDGYQDGCCIIYSDHIRACGFSWCGNYLVAACGSDINIWQRIEKC